MKPENLKEFLGQLIGEASMLWDKDHVFESTKGAELIERALKEITEFVTVK